MGEYADIKSRKIVRFLVWLVVNKGVEVSKAGRHNYKVTCIRNGKSYPIPSSHKTINRFIVKSFVEWLVENEICTKNECDNHIK